MGLLCFSLFHRFRVATPGMEGFGLQLATDDGKKLTLFLTGHRFLVSIITAALFLLDYISAFWTPKKQALHGFAARTGVANPS